MMKLKKQILKLEDTPSVLWFGYHYESFLNGYTAMNVSFLSKKTHIASILNTL